MPDLDQVWATYKYPISVKILSYILVPVASVTLFFMGWYLLFQSWMSLFFFLGSIGFMFLFIFNSFAISTIIVSNGGIGARNLGGLLKHIRWQNVTKIIKHRQWNIASNSYDDNYSVFDGDYGFLRQRMVNLRGPIVFTGKIEGVRALVDSINSYARQYHFPLFIIDEEVFSKNFAEGKVKRPKYRLPPVPIDQI